MLTSYDKYETPHTFQSNFPQVRLLVLPEEWSQSRPKSRVNTQIGGRETKRPHEAALTWTDRHHGRPFPLTIQFNLTAGATGDWWWRAGTKRARPARGPPRSSGRDINQLTGTVASGALVNGPITSCERATWVMAGIICRECGFNRVGFDGSGGDFGAEKRRLLRERFDYDINLRGTY